MKGGRSISSVVWGETLVTIIYKKTFVNNDFRIQYNSISSVLVSDVVWEFMDTPEFQLQHASILYINDRDTLCVSMPKQKDYCRKKLDFFF